MNNEWFFFKLERKIFFDLFFSEFNISKLNFFFINKFLNSGIYLKSSYLYRWWSTRMATSISIMMVGEHGWVVLVDDNDVESLDILIVGGRLLANWSLLGYKYKNSNCEFFCSNIETEFKMLTDTHSQNGEVLSVNQHRGSGNKKKKMKLFIQEI